ncbi:MAG: hypothetical protein DIU80_006220 [Chloroflexota bacterium]|nr:MAG: hypothetical protein DIU80_01335 [Chloroflexota bacterium]
MQTLEESFQQVLLDSYQELATLGYQAKDVLQMVQEIGAVYAARKLVKRARYREDFMRLWELGRLELSVEALVLRPEYRTLFNSDERKHARQRLADMGYRAPWDYEFA